MNSNWSCCPERAKWGHDLCDVELWPLTFTFCIDTTLVNGNNSWKFRCDTIHDSHEIAILEFPTSDCSQNEAWCHAKRTDVTVPPISQPNSHISGLKYGEKLFITYLGIILVNLQGGWFSPIHQEMRLITYFQKAFKNPCFEVIHRPFYWSNHILY